MRGGPPGWAKAAIGASMGCMILLAGVGLALDRAFPPDLGRLDGLASEIRDRTGQPLGYLPAPGGVWRFAAAPGSVSPVFLRLLIETEDRRFGLHPGVDPWALARAAVQMARAGRVVSGGSTLAMQAARLLHPQPRTLGAKLAEIARALQLQRRYGGDGVLGIWLTLAPFGGNLEGVQAGALGWFGHDAAALEPHEAALLVALPRRPEALRPDRHAEAAARVRGRVLALGVRTGVFPAEAGPDVPVRRLAFLRHAPQVIAALPRAPVVATTLDLPLQRALERWAAGRNAALPPRVSMAAIVAEAGAREIRAVYAGAWGEGGRAGSLDLTRAVRSPGSALKPLIYGLAFAEGIVTPDTLLSDIPRRFGAYAPENYDRGFAGAVTAGEALQRSLNLPAVALLARIGPVRFASVLRAAGVEAHLPSGAAPSLSLALGGEGMTLRHLAGVYAALATDGRFVPLSLQPDGAHPARPEGNALLPARAAAETAAVLTRPVAPGGPGGIAWKTGTSWGGRDAWAAGFDARHVVAVWVGRPDGTPLPGATGTALALPLVEQLFALLPPAPRPPGWRSAAEPQAGLALGREHPAALHLLFPPDGAVLSNDGPVTIRVMGGKRPLTFLVDGRPLPAETAKRETAWRPGGPGSYRLTVLDALGASARAELRVQ